MLSVIDLPLMKVEWFSGTKEIRIGLILLAKTLEKVLLKIFHHEIGLKSLGEVGNSLLRMRERMVALSYFKRVPLVEKLKHPIIEILYD